MTAPLTQTQRVCLKCDHAWWPRKAERPSQCPKCHSATWDKPRKPIADEDLAVEVWK